MNNAQDVNSTKRVDSHLHAVLEAADEHPSTGHPKGSSSSSSRGGVIPSRGNREGGRSGRGGTMLVEVGTDVVVVI